MKRRYTYIIYTLMLMAGNIASAQLSPSLNDTLKIKDVIIRGNRNLRSAGFTRTAIDSTLLREHLNWSLSDMLRSGSTLFVKSYGPGGIATLSLRGAGASHTVVTWNGISLNSPMLGQSDLLLIPAIVADEVTVCNGGASVAMSQGGLGGVVDVGTRASWNDPSVFEISASAGGYGRYSGSLIGRYGGESWRFATRINYGYSGNDFRYLNNYLTNESVYSRRENASYNQKVAVQEAWYRNSQSVTGFKIWIQETLRDIPSPINVSPSSHDEHLDTKNFRGILSHDRYYSRNIAWSSSAAFLKETMLYQDNVTKISSLSTSNLFSAKSSLLINEGHNTALKATLSTEASSVANESYQRQHSRYVTGLSISADHGLNSYADLNANAVFTIVDKKIIPPDISTGVEVKPFPEKEYSIKANFAYKSRIPTFNDLYWVPGGNPLLKTERAFNSEVSLNMGNSIGRTSFSGTTSFYLNTIENMIVWKPGTGGLWSPVNSGEVHARGIEAEFSAEWRRGDKHVMAVSSYNYTSSTDMNSNSQQIYVPKHMAHAGLRSSVGLFVAGVAWNYTGERFITAENDQYLPAYTVSDLWVGIRYSVNGYPAETTVRFENVFYTGYQVVAYHPMPLGSIIINSSVKFSKGKKR